MESKRCILHFPFYIDEKFPSGSNIRPLKLIEAFNNLGYRVDVIKGYGSDRKHKIEEIKNNILNGIKYEFLYSESSTEPTILTEKDHMPKYPLLDFNFFKFCKKSNIKIGLFYRDVYWVFDEYKKRIPFYKRIPAILSYKHDLNMYNKFIDVLYLPSKKMYKYIPFSFKGEILELPPAADKIDHNNYKIINDNKLKIFYVGGVSELYNIQKLFEAASKRNYVELTVCCRENEWESEKEKYIKYLDCKRICVVHESGEALNKYFENADLFSLFFEPNKYREFSMPVKLFQYLGHKKPIITTKDTATGEFVRRYNIGWEIDYSTRELSILFDMIIKDKNIMKEKIESIENILNDNTWEARVRQIEKDLSKL